jgi:superfamily II DNA helicase RecQ
MQQFMQSTTKLQPQVSDVRTEIQDLLWTLPMGQAWFDAVPLQPLLSPDSLSLVVYPNQSLLKNHVFRLMLRGLQPQDFAALTLDMPPHEERDVWERVSRQEVPLLFLTARKLQTIKALSNLVRHPNLGPILLEQGHLVVPNVWGPFSTNPYEKLTQLFKEQWPGHPPLHVFSAPLPLQEQEFLKAGFRLRYPQTQHAEIPLEELDLNVHRAIVPIQKLNALIDFIESGIESPTASVIICHSLKQLLQLEKRLNAFSPLIFHRQVDTAQKEMQIMQMMHQPHAVILIESAMLSELPLYLIPFAEVRMALWQIPWSCEALIQQAMPAVHPETKTLSSLVLYLKDDYVSQKRWLSQQNSPQRSYSIHRDHLNRLRHFCVKSNDCRKRQVANWLGQNAISTSNCNICDRCQQQGRSSLWRNLLNPILY